MTAKVIDRGRKNQELLVQPQYKPWAVEDEIAVIYCGVNGLLENVPLDKVHEFESLLLELLKAKYQKEVLTPLREGKLTAEVEELLRKCAAEVSGKYNS